MIVGSGNRKTTLSIHWKGRGRDRERQRKTKTEEETERDRDRWRQTEMEIEREEMGWDYMPSEPTSQWHTSSSKATLLKGSNNFPKMSPLTGDQAWRVVEFLIRTTTTCIYNLVFPKKKKRSVCFSECIFGLILWSPVSYRDQKIATFLQIP